MKHLQSQRKGNYRLRFSILGLMIVLFTLPYFTDVAYYADQTPTHYAQESSKVEGKVEASVEKIPLVVANAQINSVVGNNLSSQDVRKRIGHPIRGTPSSQRIFHGLIISRPPPVA